MLAGDYFIVEPAASNLTMQPCELHRPSGKASRAATSNLNGVVGVILPRSVSVASHLPSDFLTTTIT
jgi:hypothetical protein